MEKSRDTLLGFKQKEKDLYKQMNVINNPLLIYVFLQSLHKQQEPFQALKLADKILEKHPAHIETIHIKALNLLIQKREKEAFELVNHHLFKNLSSLLLWKTLGLLHKNQRNYEEARKCFMNAKKYQKQGEEKTKYKVDEELSNNYLLMKNYEAYTDLRRVLLQESSMNIANWLCLAMGLYLQGKKLEALEVCQSFEKSLSSTKKKLTTYQKNSLTMLEVRILEELGQYQKAIYLLNLPNRVIDKLGLYERLARLYHLAGDTGNAALNLGLCVSINPANNKYYEQFLEMGGIKDVTYATELSAEDQQKVLEYVKHYEEKQDLKAFVMKYLTGERFESNFEDYSQKMIPKQSPAYLLQIKGLYAQNKNTAGRIQSIEKILVQFLEKDPSNLWAKIYLAQHYQLAAQKDKAQTHINEILNLNVTEADQFLVLARTLREIGNLEKAGELGEKARELDLSDRYFSTFSAKFQLSLGNIEKAHEIMLPFSTMPVTKEFNSFILQTLWYEVALGKAYQKAKNYKKALQTYDYVVDHFVQYEKSFNMIHTYNLGHFNLEAYIQMIETGNNMYHNKYAVKATIGIIECLNEIAGKRDQEIENVKADRAKWLESAEYKQLKVEEKRKRESDDYEFNLDTHGFDIYSQYLESIPKKFVEHVQQVVDQNKDDQDLFKTVKSCQGLQDKIKF
eukprot:403350531